MNSTIRYFSGCPHWAVARDRVDEAIRISERDDPVRSWSFLHDMRLPARFMAAITEGAV
jgi:hypothetical protein